MRLIAIAMLLAVPLPAPFGDAEATALSVADDGSAVLEVTVEVTGAPAAVLVRGVGLVDELPPVALVPRGDGTYGGLVELNTTVGVRLAFEYLPSGGGSSTITDLYTLVQLGVDPAALTGATAPDLTPTPTTTVAARDGGDDRDEARWGWLALAAGSAGLAALLVWLWMGRGPAVDNRSGNPDNSLDADSEPVSPAEA